MIDQNLPMIYLVSITFLFFMAPVHPFPGIMDGNLYVMKGTVRDQNNTPLGRYKVTPTIIFDNSKIDEDLETVSLSSSGEFLSVIPEEYYNDGLRIVLRLETRNEITYEIVRPHNWNIQMPKKQNDTLWIQDIFEFRSITPDQGYREKYFQTLNEMRRIMNEKDSLEYMMQDYLAEKAQDSLRYIAQINEYDAKLDKLNGILREYRRNQENESAEILTSLDIYLDDLKNLNQVLTKKNIRDVFLYPENLKYFEEIINEYNSSRANLADSKNSYLNNIARYWEDDHVQEDLTRAMNEVYTLIFEDINAGLLTGSSGEWNPENLSLNGDILDQIDQFVKQRTPRIVAQKRAVKAAGLIHGLLDLKIRELETKINDLNSAFSEAM